MANMNREQLVLDVINRKNTNYVPSVVNFANAKKKMECAAYVGITGEGGTIVWGVGEHHDIVTASIRGLISAINRSMED